MDRTCCSDHESWVFPGGVFFDLAILGVEVGQLIDSITERGVRGVFTDNINLSARGALFL